MKKPLVSIITVTFNRAKYLEETISSVKNQDYLNIEHIIIDGGSTDNTLEIIKKYEGAYNMKWISEKDEGIADALNKGFGIAKGDIFCWLDSDDTYLPGTIKKVVEIFKKHPQIDLVFGDILIINDKSQVINYIKFTDFSFETFIYEGGCINPAATFWRRELYNKLGGIDKEYMWSPDYNFFAKAGASKAIFYHIRDFLAAYRHHSNQILGNKNYFRKGESIFDIKLKEHKKIIQKYTSDFTEGNIRWKKRKILIKRAFKYIKQGDLLYVLRGGLKRTGILHIPLPHKN